MIDTTTRSTAAHCPTGAGTERTNRSSPRTPSSTTTEPAPRAVTLSTADS